VEFETCLLYVNCQRARGLIKSLRVFIKEGNNILDESNRQAYYSPLDILVCGLSAREREGRLFAMFGAYIDDSGSHEQSPFMILAGLVAEKEVWDDFSDEWQAAIDAAPRIDYFKSTEAATLTGCFEGFSRVEAEVKTDMLTDIALNRILYGMLTTILWDDFNNILKCHTPKPKGALKYFLRHPYYSCYHDIISCIADIHMRNRHILNGKVDFMFDNQGKEGERCKRLYDALKPDMPEEIRAVLGEVYQGDDKVHLPLQAADLMAWQNRNRNLPGKESTRSYTKIVDSKKVVYNQITAPELREFIGRNFNLLLRS
jgi:uncharacterized protein DUF3800